MDLVVSRNRNGSGNGAVVRSLPQVSPPTAYNFDVTIDAGKLLAEACETAQRAIEKQFCEPGITPSKRHIEVMAQLLAAVHTYQKQSGIKKCHSLLPKAIQELLGPSEKESAQPKPCAQQNNGHGSVKNVRKCTAITEYFNGNFPAAVTAIEQKITTALTSIQNPTDKDMLEQALIPGRKALNGLPSDPGAFFLSRGGWFDKIFDGLDAFNPRIVTRASGDARTLGSSAQQSRCTIWLATATFARTTSLKIFEAAREKILLDRTDGMLYVEAHRKLNRGLRDFLSTGDPITQMRSALKAAIRLPTDAPPALEIRGAALIDYMKKNKNFFSPDTKHAVIDIIRVINFLTANRLLLERSGRSADGVARGAAGGPSGQGRKFLAD